VTFLQKQVKGHGHKVQMFGTVGKVLTQGRHMRSLKALCTVLFKEIDWITGFLPANSGQSGLKLQLKPG